MFAIADTHAVIWYLLADPRLSEAARMAFASAADQKDPIGISSISLVEIIYLTEKKRIPREALAILKRELEIAGSVLELVPLDKRIALAVEEIVRDAVPEMPDRIVTAPARYFDLPLITRDLAMQAHYPKFIW